MAKSKKGTATRDSRRAAAGRDIPPSKPPPRSVPVVEAKHPVDNAVDTFFSNDARVRDAMSRNLKERSASALKGAARAKAAFARFAPSKYSAEEKARRNVVPAGASPAEATRAVVDKGVAAMRVSAPRRAMKVHLGGDLGELIEDRRGGSLGRIDLAELIDYVGTKIATGPINVDARSAFTDCQAEIEAQRRLDIILGDVEGPKPKAPTDKQDAAAAAMLEADALVSEQVRKQMHTATSPEEELLFAVPSRATPKETDKAIASFELRAGPTDVTSYHDFNDLQIAFEHVWSEIFDGRLAKLGQDLYHEYVKLQEFVGVDPANHRIDTIEDLRNLMAEIRQLAKLTNDETPSSLQPKDPAASSGGAGNTDNTVNDVVDVVATVLDPGSIITDAIGDETVAAILNPAGAIIGAIADLIKGTPQITWASFPGPLPGNADLISVKIQPNVCAAGIVEIEIKTGPNTGGWKALAFFEYDQTGKVVCQFNISNDPNDAGVWDRASYSVLPLYTPQVLNSVLEFHHEGMFGAHTRCFIMTGLAEKLKDRSRVTFTWLKDR